MMAGSALRCGKRGNEWKRGEGEAGVVDQDETSFASHSEAESMCAYTAHRKAAKDLTYSYIFSYIFSSPSSSSGCSLLHACSGKEALGSNSPHDAVGRFRLLPRSVFGVFAPPVPPEEEEHRSSSRCTIKRFTDFRFYASLNFALLIRLTR